VDNSSDTADHRPGDMIGLERRYGERNFPGATDNCGAAVPDGLAMTPEPTWADVVGDLGEPRQGPVQRGSNDAKVNTNFGSLGW
jgi:hypothetical protein